eukprot:364292-Chlamydomonas_euryale.AAC.2
MQHGSDSAPGKEWEQGVVRHAQRLGSMASSTMMQCGSVDTALGSPSWARGRHTHTCTHMHA